MEELIKLSIVVAEVADEICYKKTAILKDTYLIITIIISYAGLLNANASVIRSVVL